MVNVKAITPSWVIDAPCATPCDTACDAVSPERVASTAVAAAVPGPQITNAAVPTNSAASRRAIRISATTSTFLDPDCLTLSKYIRYNQIHFREAWASPLLVSIGR